MCSIIYPLVFSAKWLLIHESIRPRKGKLACICVLDAKSVMLPQRALSVSDYKTTWQIQTSLRCPVLLPLMSPPLPSPPLPSPPKKRRRIASRGSLAPSGQDNSRLFSDEESMGEFLELLDRREASALLSNGADAQPDRPPPPPPPPPSPSIAPTPGPSSREPEEREQDRCSGD